MENVLPRRQRKQKTEKQDDDWATVAAIGMKTALRKSSNEGVKALFHDPIAVARQKEARSLSVYGDGKKIYHKGSREHAIIEEITKMEKQLHQRLSQENEEAKKQEARKKHNGVLQRETKTGKRNAGCTESGDSGSHEGPDRKDIERIISLKLNGNEAVQNKNTV